MEAVFQECFEREITKAERNINNKAGFFCFASDSLLRSC